MEFWKEFLKDAGKTLGFGFFFGLGCAAAFWLVLYLSQRRSVWRLARLDCPSCGVRFGLRVAKIARRRYRAECRRVREKLEGKAAFIDFGHLWPVECDQCHHEAAFHEVRGTLQQRA